MALPFDTFKKNHAHSHDICCHVFVGHVDSMAYNILAIAKYTFDCNCFVLYNIFYTLYCQLSVHSEGEENVGLCTMRVSDNHFYHHIPI